MLECSKMSYISMSKIMYSFAYDISLVYTLFVLFFLKEFFGNWSYLEKDSGFFFINIYLTEYLT